MSRIWEIIEHSRGGKPHKAEDKNLVESYECGYEDGYEDAMKEMESHHKSQMGERSYRIRDQYTGKDPGASDNASYRGDSMGRRDNYSGREGSSMGEREFMRESMREVMSERRGRDSMGRYR